MRVSRSKILHQRNDQNVGRLRLAICCEAPEGDIETVRQMDVMGPLATGPKRLETLERCREFVSHGWRWPGVCWPLVALRLACFWGSDELVEVGRLFSRLA
jgi:hypothetical protein